MKKLLLILFSIAFFSQSFAQYNIAYSFKIRYHHSRGWSKITVAEGNFTEGTQYTIPAFTMPNSVDTLQAAYDALVGSTFELETGALDNDIKLVMTLDGLDLVNGLYQNVGEQILFMRLDVDVYDPADSSTPVDSNYWFNPGHAMVFSIPLQASFISFVESIGLTQAFLAFAYITDDQFSSLNIQTSISASHISFSAEHLSTFGGGSTEIVSVNKSSNTEIPSIYTLEQNYPNPFNPTTNINFSLPESGFVTLKVYNALGAEVKTLVSNSMAVGAHSIEFNAQNLPSGIYFYTLKSNNIILTKKMLLLK